MKVPGDGMHLRQRREAAGGWEISDVDAGCEPGEDGDEAEDVANQMKQKWAECVRVFACA